MDKDSLELFRLKRKRVMKLGVTEEQYNDMISSAVTWFGQAIQEYEDRLYPASHENKTMQVVIGGPVNSALNRLQYCSRLLRDELWDTDEPQAFYKDQWELLKILKEDWQNAQHQA